MNASRAFELFFTVNKEDWKAFGPLLGGRGVAVEAKELSEDDELRAIVRKHAGKVVVDASHGAGALPHIRGEVAWLDGVFEAGFDTPRDGFVEKWIPSNRLTGDFVADRLETFRREGRAVHVVEPDSLIALVPHCDVVKSASSSLWRRATESGLFLAFDYAFVSGVHVPTLQSFPWPGTDDQSTLTAARELQDWSHVAKRLGVADAQDETIAVAVSLDSLDRFVDAVGRVRPAVLRAMLGDGPEEVRKSFFVSKRETAETRSGSDRGLPSIALGDVVSAYSQTIVLRSPAVSIVGSVATQGESQNDVDFLVHGPLDEATRKAIEVRLGRALPPAISRRAQYHDESLGGPISDHCHVYDLALVPRKDAAQVVRMAEGDVVDELLDSPQGARAAVVQVHTRGQSAHIDFRLPVGDGLVGWTLFAQRPGEAPNVEDVDGAKALYSSWSPKTGNRFFKPIAVDSKLRAVPKKKHPKEWLDVEGEVFGEGEVGATRGEKGVVVAVARPQVEVGLQTPDFHEYFLSGDKAWRGPLYFRRIVGDDAGEPVWVVWLGASALPSVLGRRAVEAGTMPPVGQSAMSEALRVVTPQEFHFWTAKTPAEARRIRDALVASKFFTEANVRLVDGVPRRVVTKVFLDEPEAPELWEDPWGEPGTIWGDVEKIEKRGKRLFGAPTSKAQLAPRLVKLFPEHKTYVEPFCCTASVLFAKPRSQKEVLGDLDADVIHALKSCRDITKERLAKLRAMNWKGSNAYHKKLRHGATPKGDLERLHRFLYLRKFAYFGIIRGFNVAAEGKDGSGAVDKVERLAPRLKGVDIRRTDYEALVTKHDSPSTFFFFDPPYDKGRGGSGKFGQVDDTTFDEERFVKVLKTIRGKFLVTYGTHGKLAQLAKDAGFRVRKFRSRSSTGFATRGPNKRWLTQVMISNYDPSKTATFEGEVEKGDETFVVDCGFDRGSLFDPTPIEARKGASERHRAAGRGALFRAHKCGYPVDFPKTGKASGPQCKAPATKAIIWADGRAFVPVCEKHVEPGMAMLRKKNGSWAEIVGTRKLPKDDEQGIDWWHSKNRGKGWHKKNYPSLYKADDFAPDVALEKAGAQQITIFKTEEERYVLGVVLEPTDGKDGAELKPDSQKDIYSKAEVRQAAHRFMEEFRNVGLMHRTLVNGRVKILESFVVPEGTGGFKLTDPEGVVQKVQEGTWLLGLRIADDELWEQVKSGALGGLSIGGSARRVPSRT